MMWWKVGLGLLAWLGIILAAGWMFGGMAKLGGPEDPRCGRH